MDIGEMLFDIIRPVGALRHVLRRLTRVCPSDDLRFKGEAGTDL